MPTENSVAAQAGDEPIKRYDLTYRDDFNSKHGADADEADEGQWVRFSDVEHLIVSPRATADVERDAVRYRWLRDSARGMANLMDVITETNADPWYELKCDAALDAAIDAAIATTKPGA